jgi:hypothetical protein
MDTQTATMTPETTLPPPNGVNHAKPQTPPKTKKAKKMTAKKGKPSTTPAKPKKKNPEIAKAQGAKRGKPERTELKITDMTPEELKILRAVFTPKGDRPSHKINDLQAKCFGKEKTGSSTTRNSLRRLVKFGWLEKADRGAYRLTEKGRKRGIKAD